MPTWLKKISKPSRKLIEQKIKKLLAKKKEIHLNEEELINKLAKAIVKDSDLTYQIDTDPESINQGLKKIIEEI